MFPIFEILIYNFYFTTQIINQQLKGRNCEQLPVTWSVVGWTILPILQMDQGTTIRIEDVQDISPALREVPAQSWNTTGVASLVVNLHFNIIQTTLQSRHLQHVPIMVPLVNFLAINSNDHVIVAVRDS